MFEAKLTSFLIFSLLLAAFIYAQYVFLESAGFITAIMSLIIPGLFFFLGHLFSFFLHKEAVKNEGELLFLYFERVLPMTILAFSGLFLPEVFFPVLMILKTLFDLEMHIVINTTQVHKIR